MLLYYLMQSSKCPVGSVLNSDTIQHCLDQSPIGLIVCCQSRDDVGTIYMSVSFLLCSSASLQKYIKYEK